MNVNNLTPDQKQLISQWVEEGLDLNAIQKKLNGECGLNLTFMDTRFLLLDLGLEIKSTQQKAPQAAASSQEDPAPAGAQTVVEESPALPEADLPHGNLELSLDDVTPQGLMVSGKVKFPSGAHGGWFLDNQYRVGIDPDADSPEPTEKDMMIFEREIERFLRSQMGSL